MMPKVTKPTNHELWQNPETREEARRYVSENIRAYLEWCTPWARYQRLKQWHESLTDMNIKAEIYERYIERVDAKGKSGFGGTNALLHLAQFHIALMYADQQALNRKKAVGGQKGAASKRQEREGVDAKIRAHWERLAESGMSERDRASVIAPLVGMSASSVRRKTKILKMK